MPIMACYVDDATMARLKDCSDADSQGRSPTELAEAAISEAALEATRNTPAPPINPDNVRR